jgi:hypothetical protein
MDFVERNGDVDGEDAVDGLDIACERSTVIREKADDAVADEVTSLDALGTTGSSKRRIASVLTR